MKKFLYILLPVLAFSACEEKSTTVDYWMTVPHQARQFAAECRAKYGASLQNIPRDCTTAYDATFRLLTVNAKKGW